MFKRLFSIFLAATMTLSLTGCGPKRESAQSVVEKAILAIKNLDSESAQTYWGSDSLESVGAITNADTDEQSIEIMKLLTQNLSYSITNSLEDEQGGTATVSVDFTNTDMSLVMAEYMENVMSDILTYAFLPADQQPSDEEMEQLYMDKLTEAMSADDNESITNSVDITLSLIDDQWQIDTSNSAKVLDAMMGGLFSYLDSMSEQFGTLEEE